MELSLTQELDSRHSAADGKLRIEELLGGRSISYAFLRKDEAFEYSFGDSTLALDFYYTINGLRYTTRCLDLTALSDACAFFQRLRDDFIMRMGHPPIGSHTPLEFSVVGENLVSSDISRILENSHFALYHKKPHIRFDIIQTNSLIGVQDSGTIE